MIQVNRIWLDYKQKLWTWRFIGFCLIRIHQNIINYKIIQLIINNYTNIIIHMVAWCSLSCIVDTEIQNHITVTTRGWEILTNTSTHLQTTRGIALKISLQQTNQADICVRSSSINKLKITEITLTDLLHYTQRSTVLHLQYSYNILFTIFPYILAVLLIKTRISFTTCSWYTKPLCDVSIQLKDDKNLHISYIRKDAPINKSSFYDDKFPHSLFSYQLWAMSFCNQWTTHK